ncbi:MAG: hypothetical protein AB9Q17_02390 [Candidatus Reddybacter sp.]
MGLPLDATNQTYGMDSTNTGEIIRINPIDRYVEWVDDGLQNSEYRTSTDGSCFKADMTAAVPHENYVMFVQARSVEGDFTTYGYNLLSNGYDPADAGTTGSSHALTLLASSIVFESTNRNVTFTDLFIWDKAYHSYAFVSEYTGGVKTLYAYRDGALFGSGTVQRKLESPLSRLTIGCSHADHNRGGNVVVTLAGLFEGADHELARSISENPNQILKPRRKYWVMPTAAGGSAPIMASALRGA